jgi:hypothetical protein
VSAITSIAAEKQRRVILARTACENELQTSEHVVFCLAGKEMRIGGAVHKIPDPAI